MTVGGRGKRATYSTFNMHHMLHLPRIITCLDASCWVRSDHIALISFNNISVIPSSVKTAKSCSIILSITSAQSLIHQTKSISLIIIGIPLSVKISKSCSILWIICHLVEPLTRAKQWPQRNSGIMCQSFLCDTILRRSTGLKTLDNNQLMAGDNRCLWGWTSDHLIRDHQIAAGLSIKKFLEVVKS